VRALTHRTEAAATLPANVEAVTGDLTMPESLDAALDAVSAVFLVWTAPPATVQEVVERVAAHTRRVVFLSSPHQTPHPFFQQPNPMAVLHADIERNIAEAGLESTIIRPGMFASNALFWWAPAIRGGNVVRWPYGAAETAPVDERDVAAVAARTLYQNGYAGGDYVLTGPESLSQAEQVRIIGDVLGHRITFEELTPDEFRSETESTWPRPAVDMLLDAWGATIGIPAFVTSTVFDMSDRRRGHFGSRSPATPLRSLTVQARAEGDRFIAGLFCGTDGRSSRHGRWPLRSTRWQTAKRKAVAQLLRVLEKTTRRIPTRMRARRRPMKRATRTIPTSTPAH
jgi:uncharacterized protein YbjT (DUF2867 family)